MQLLRKYACVWNAQRNVQQSILRAEVWFKEVEAQITYSYKQQKKPNNFQGF